MTLPLLPYQEIGAAFLAGKERGALFDEMGVGKTAQAIAALDLVGAKRGIIVAPAKAHKMGVWAGEHRKFSATPRRLLKGRSLDDLNLFMRGRADVLMLSYEMMTNWKKHLIKDLYDFEIYDESHRLKNREAGRSRAALGVQADGRLGLGERAAHTWFLTGTPMANDPSDIFTHARFCQGTTLTHRQFCDRYFKSRSNGFATKYKPREEMVPELQQVIRSFSLRRSAKEAGLDLPPIWFTTLSLEGDTSDVRQLLKDYPGLDEAILRAVEEGGLSFLDAQHVATLRRLIGEAKAPSYAELLVEELEGSEAKRVFMCSHKRPLHLIIEHLRAAGIDAVYVDGSTSDRSDYESITRFQNDPKCRVFGGNIQAAGEAITLTAAADIDIVEMSWTPKDNAQAIKRIHRVSQTQTCRARFISLANSFDQVVSENVAEKSAAIAKASGWEVGGVAA